MTVLPERYQPALGLYETQKAIGLIKNIFQVKLCAALHLKRVTAPLFVDPATGLNDDLNGVERPVGFDIPAVGIEGQVVHSLAKWKRLALHDYNFFVGNGLVADMNAIRRDEELDNLHSIYVDQWDWEKVIDESTRNEATLKDTVERIVSAICSTLDELKWQFSQLSTELCREVTFLTAQELEDRYPDKTPKEREQLIVKEHKTVFLQKIGGKLDTQELDAEMESLRKQLRQLTGTKDRLGEQIDALDYDDPHYTRKAQDLQERQDKLYDQIAAIEVSMAEVQTRMENIRQHRISTDNVYQFLLYSDKLYGQFTELEKKTFMNSFIERVEIFPERQSDGRIIKRIEFRFPVYIQGAERTALSWDETDMSETVLLFSH